MGHFQAWFGCAFATAHCCTTKPRLKVPLIAALGLQKLNLKILAHNLEMYKSEIMRTITTTKKYNRNNYIL